MKSVCSCTHWYRPILSGYDWTGKAWLSSPSRSLPLSRPAFRSLPQVLPQSIGLGKRCLEGSRECMKVGMVAKELVGGGRGGGVEGGRRREREEEDSRRCAGSCTLSCCLRCRSSRWLLALAVNFSSVRCSISL